MAVFGEFATLWYGNLMFEPFAFGAVFSFDLSDNDEPLWTMVVRAVDLGGHLPSVGDFVFDRATRRVFRVMRIFSATDDALYRARVRIE